ncbi:MAG: 50S ribosomal protein L19 [Patescibacteria group bacterium]
MLTTFDFKPGDIIKVYQKITEGEKTRIQMFKGTLLAVGGRGENKMFTVMKKVGQISVERIWPIHSPNIEKIELDAHPKRTIRRAKLNYLKLPKTV